MELLDGIGRLLEEVLLRLLRLLEVNIDVVPTELELEEASGGGVELDDSDAEVLEEGVGEELGVGESVGEGVGEGVSEGVGEGVGEGIGVGVGAGVDESVLLGGGGGGEVDDFGESDMLFCPSPGPFFPPSNTTKLALEPFGTVTTQKVAPPTPMVAAPSISLTLCFEGSMAQGSPLQCPSHTISTPHVGILSRNGVVGSRYIGFQASLMNVSPFLFVLAPATKGDQLPHGFWLDPHTHASSVETPGGLM